MQAHGETARPRWVSEAGYVLLAVLVGLAVAMALNGVLDGAVVERAERDLSRTLEHMSPHVVEILETGGDLGGEIEREAHVLGFRLTVISPDGKVLADSNVDPARLGTVENHSHRPEVERARQTGLGFDRRRSTTVSEPFLYAARRLDRQGSPVGFLRFAVSENEIRRSEEPFRTRLTALSTLTGLLAGLLLLAIRRRHFSELHVLREAVKGASLGQEPHVTLQTSSETAEILSTLGEITRRLASADARGAGGEELLATVLENVPSGVLTFDTGLKLVSANEIAARILGLPQDRLKKGAHALEICRDTSFSRSLERAIAGEGSTELALPLEGRTLKVVVAGAGVGRAGGARGAVAVIAGT